MSRTFPELKASDLLAWPTLLTGVRLGIAVSFPFLVHEPLVALFAYAVALLTDVLDGWCARRLGCASQAGAVADGWVDKILHVNAAWAMWNHDLMPGIWLLPLFARELLQFPQILWLAGPFYRGEVCAQESSFSGKLTSSLQAVTFVAVFLGAMPVAGVTASLTGLAGGWAAFEYAVRERTQGYGRAI